MSPSGSGQQETTQQETTLQHEFTGNESTRSAQPQIAEEMNDQSQTQCAEDSDRQRQESRSNTRAEMAFSTAYDIWTMNSDGTNPKKLTHSGEEITDPALSPDGKRIAFTATDYELSSGSPSSATPEALPSIYVMNADGSGDPRRLTSAFAENPAWSPDGKKIAFERSREIYVIKASCEEDSTNQAQRLTEGPGWNVEPVWSPDGSELAFTHVDLDSDYGVILRNTDVYKMDADGSKETRLTHTYSNKNPEQNPAWSPSGKQIAFMTGFYTGTGDTSAKLYLMNSYGSVPNFVRTFPQPVGSYLQNMELAWQ